MESIVKQLLKFWNKEEKCFIVTEKDKFFVDLLLKRAYNEVSKDADNQKFLAFLED